MGGYIRELRALIGPRLITLPSVTTVLFDDRDRILLIRHREGGRWLAPGGMIEPGERPADAALRELWEETGWVARLDGLLGVFGGPEFLVRYANGDEVTYVMSVFAAVPVRRHGPAGSDEALEQRFVSRAEMSSLDLAEWARVVLPGVWAARRSPAFAGPHWQPPDPAPDGGLTGSP